MRTGLKMSVWVMACVLCAGVCGADAGTSHKQKKVVKKPDLPPLPSGPQGPLQSQIPLDAIPAVAPQVTYRDGQLTVVAPNSTLAEILRAVRRQTGAEMEIPPGATERVVTHLGPGPARQVVAELLNGSRFNYVLLGSPLDANRLTRVVLVAKTGADVPGATPQPQQFGANQPGMNQPAMQQGAPIQQDAAAIVQDTPEAEAAEENADENADENAADNADAAQPTAPNPDQPGVRTPQQMLQEMQQRQLQLQQQQQPGQVPPGYPQVGMPQPQPPPQPQQPPQQ